MATLIEDLLSKANELAKQRKIYTSLVNKLVDENKLEQENKPILDKQQIYSRLPLTQYELLEFGEKLDKEYDFLTNDNTDSWEVCTGEEIEKKWNVKFDQTYEDIYDQYDQRNNNGWLEKPQLEYKDSANENYKNEYYRCLNKINEFGFNIYRIKKNPNGFKNREPSEYSGETKTFYFYCQKNNWQFIVTFIDHCECEPGMLYIDEVTNISTDITHNINCDLYCQNTGGYILKNFLALLDCNALEEFYDKRFGVYLEIPKLLEGMGYGVIMNIGTNTNTLPQNNIHVNKHNLYFRFNVSNNQGEVMVILTHNYKHGDYELTITPTIEQILDDAKNNAENNPDDWGAIENYKTTKEWLEEFNINALNFCVKESCKVPYRSKNDILVLSYTINNFINYQKGNYGFYEDMNWFNGTYFKRYFNRYFVNDNFWYLNEKATYNINSYDALKSPEINVIVNLQFGRWYGNKNIDVKYIRDLKLSAELEKNSDEFFLYPFEYYKIRFYYDSYRNCNNCYLRIQGGYKYTHASDSERFKIDDIVLAGKFSELFEKFKIIFEQLLEINK